MNFNIVIGNPPYNDDIYIEFVKSSIELSKKYICMITPAKWFAKGGNGSNYFRHSIAPLMSNLVYYIDSGDIFNIRLHGGISYYLINTTHHSNTCNIENRCTRVPLLSSHGKLENRQLLNNDICILNPIAIINILNKVGVFSEVFTPLKFYDTPIQGNYNAVVSSVNADCGGKTSFHIFSKDGTIPMLAPIKITNEPCEISNDTMCLFSSKNKDEVASFISYITTKLVRFLLLCRYHSYHNNNIETWRFVPSVENFNHAYTDSELYSVYNLNDEEINLIESIIKESSDTILMLK